MISVDAGEVVLALELSHGMDFWAFTESKQIKEKEMAAEAEIKDLIHHFVDEHMGNDELVEVMHELEEDAAEWRTDVDDVETTVSSGSMAQGKGAARRTSSVEHDTNDRGASAILREAAGFGIAVHSNRHLGGGGNGEGTSKIPLYIQCSDSYLH